MLDRTAEIAPAVAEPRSGDKRRAARRWLRRFFAPSVAAWRFLVAQSSSSLTRRIVVLNLAGLLALVISILYLSQFRASLIDARVQSLLVQGEIIAGAIAASATVETDTITIDPDKLLELQTGESYGPIDESLSALEFPINPERVAPLLRRLVLPTRTQARIYDREGALLLDTPQSLRPRRRAALRPASRSDDRPSRMERAWIAIKNWFGRVQPAALPDLGPGQRQGLSGGRAGAQRPEVEHGARQRARRDHRAGRGADPALPRGARRAAALHRRAARSTRRSRPSGCRSSCCSSRSAPSWCCSRCCSRAPSRGRCAGSPKAPRRVRRRIKSRGEIPDFTYRRDEIGELSGALREMTNSLYSRIEAIESFAADVAHELKNPLTSLRSAVETMPLAKTPESRARLLAVIEHDVRRLDRLISDVSDASRLDAELQRQDVAPVDLTRLLNTVVTVANEVRRDDGVKITLAFEGGAPDAFVVPGHDSRLGQVVDNLIENARSFSPQGGTVRITARRLRNAVEITVDDDGPGIQPEAMERIFERFYTDRPHQGFGQNSGLGLSISRQIVEAHGGRIRAENRMGVATGPDGPKVLGARFVVRLPAM